MIHANGYGIWSNFCHPCYHLNNTCTNKPDKTTNNILLIVDPKLLTHHKVGMAIWANKWKWYWKFIISTELPLHTKYRKKTDRTSSNVVDGEAAW